MEEKATLARRDILHGGGALGLAGLAVAAGPFGIASTACAADAALKPINLVNPAGTLTYTEQELLKSKGYFTEFGVRATILNVSDGAKILAALISGSGDMCPGSGFSGVFTAVERGAKLKILAGAGLASGLALYSKKPDVKSVKDLVGRIVGVGGPGALLHQITVALLQKEGIDYHKVKFVNIGSSAAVFKAVVAGTVDAGPGASEYYELAEKYGVHALSDGAFWEQLPLYTNQAMYAPDQAIAEKRDALVRTLAAFAKLFRFMSSPQSKDAFVKANLVALGGKADQAAALAQWEFYEKPGRLATNLVLSDERLNYIQKLNVELGVQKKMLPISEVADMSLARDALKLLTS